MGWFTKKENEVAVATSTPPTLLFIDGGVQTTSKEAITQRMVQTVEDAEIREFLANLRASIMNIPFYLNSNAMKKSSLQAFDTCSSKLQKVDRLNLTIHEASVFGEVLYRSLPALVNKLASDAIDEDQDVFASDRFCENLIKLMRSSVDTLPVRLTDTKAKVLTGEAVSTTLLDSEKTRDSLKRVNELLKQAQMKAETLDDKFFVEQAASSYLPECIKVFSGLSNTSSSIREEAEKIFVKQMDLIASQLEQIVNRGADSQLNIMKAQLEFLEQKQRRAEGSSAIQLD